MNGRRFLCAALHPSFFIFFLVFGCRAKSTETPLVAPDSTTKTSKNYTVERKKGRLEQQLDPLLDALSSDQASKVADRIKFPIQIYALLIDYPVQGGGETPAAPLSRTTFIKEYKYWKEAFMLRQLEFGLSHLDLSKLEAKKEVQFLRGTHSRGCTELWTLHLEQGSIEITYKSTSSVEWKYGQGDPYDSLSLLHSDEIINDRKTNRCPMPMSWVIDFENERFVITNVSQVNAD